MKFDMKFSLYGTASMEADSEEQALNRMETWIKCEMYRGQSLKYTIKIDNEVSE